MTYSFAYMLKHIDITYHWIIRYEKPEKIIILYNMSKVFGFSASWLVPVWDVKAEDVLLLDISVFEIYDTEQEALAALEND